jgi:Tol biopolymer transport system component
MNADGSEKVRLTGGGSYCADWSPDGKQIVYVRYMGDAREEDIFVMNADGTGKRCVVDLERTDTRPVWAKTGKIFFLHLNALYAVNPDGSGLSRVRKPGNVDDFALSADGKMLAYHDGERIAARPLRGAAGEVTLLKPVSDFILHDPAVVPGWTRDGKSLVVAGANGDTIHGSRLYVVNARGSGLSAVPGIETALDPAWRPE